MGVYIRVPVFLETTMYPSPKPNEHGGPYSGIRVQGLGFVLGFQARMTPRIAPFEEESRAHRPFGGVPWLFEGGRACRYTVTAASM